MYIKALRILFPAIRQQKKLSALVISGILVGIGLSVAFNWWRGQFYNAIQRYDSHGVWIGIGIFTALAFIFVLVYGLTSFYTRKLEFSVREFLYDKYKNAILTANVPNKDQRAQEDLLKFSQISLSFLKAILDSALRLPVFLFILYSIISPWMLIIVVIYAILGTVGSKKVAEKLVKTEYQQEAKESNLRRKIIEAVESTHTMPSLDEVKQNWIVLAIQNKILSYFTSSYSQLGVIIPFLLLLPMYLSHVLLLGALFQATSAIDNVFDSLSVFVSCRDVIVGLQMTTMRISELDV